MTTPALLLILVTSAAVHLHKQPELADKIKSHLIVAHAFMFILFILQRGLLREERLLKLDTDTLIFIFFPFF